MMLLLAAAFASTPEPAPAPVSSATVELAPAPSADAPPADGLTGAPAAAAGGLTGPDPSAVVGPPAGAPREGEALEVMVREAAGRLRCPVCQGLPVADSPADAAVAMRNEVRVLAALGYDADQILDYFEASYGEFIRLDPKKEGFGLLVWLLPIAFGLLGGGLLLSQLRNRRVPSPPAADPELDPYLARVRAETELLRD